MCAGFLVRGSKPNPAAAAPLLAAARPLGARLAGSLVAAALAAGAGTAAAQTVSICDDDAEWPPYVSFLREDGRIHRDRYEGVMMELLPMVFGEMGMEYTYVLEPWKRCINEVRHFDTRGKYEMFTNGSSNPEREAHFLRTEPLYLTHQGVLYHGGRLPGGPRLKSAAGADAFRLCGILGYNYTMWEDAGMTAKVDTDAKDAEAVVEMLARDRCDLFLTNLEVVVGYAAIGKIKLPEVMKSEAVPGLPRTAYYGWVSRASPRAAQLRDRFNAAMLKLRASGELEAAFRRRLPNGSGL